MKDSELPDGPGVYVIHLDRPIRHVRNYLGSGKSISGRIAGHRSGNGARVIAEANRLDIGWHVSRVWKTDTEALARLIENSLKDRRDTPRAPPRPPAPNRPRSVSAPAATLLSGNRRHDHEHRQHL